MKGKYSSPPCAIVESIGLGSEPLEGFTGISREGTCFQRAMRKAIQQQISPDPPDLIIPHAPGTVKGDQAEFNAIHKIFGSDIPPLYSHKWQTGHTFGASAGLSISLALFILKNQNVPEFPYPVETKKPVIPINKIMINAAGFGGNAGSLILSRWEPAK